MDTPLEFVNIKKCRKCKLDKHLFDYSKQRLGKDGRRSTCRRCQAVYRLSCPKYKYSKEQRKIWDSSYRKTDKYRAKHREDARKHRLKYPEKVKARLAGQVIPKQPCVVCGGKKAEAHHEDYSKPHEVMWVCKEHHEEIHHGAGLK